MKNYGKSITKRVISILIAFALVFGIFPTYVIAEKHRLIPRMTILGTYSQVSLQACSLIVLPKVRQYTTQKMEMTLSQMQMGHIHIQLTLITILTSQLTGLLKLKCNHKLKHLYLAQLTE